MQAVNDTVLISVQRAVVEAYDLWWTYALDECYCSRWFFPIIFRTKVVVATSSVVYLYK